MQTADKYVRESVSNADDSWLYLYATVRKFKLTFGAFRRHNSVPCLGATAPTIAGMGLERIRDKHL